MSDIGQVVPPEDDSLIEQWQRLTNDPELLGVDAGLGDDEVWRVGVWAAEGIRAEPLESQLFDGVEWALRTVSGVTSVWHEDREQWVIEGTAPGRELITAVAAFLDEFEDSAAESFHLKARSGVGPFVRVVLERLEDRWRFTFTREDGSRQVVEERKLITPAQAQNVWLARMDDDPRAYDLIGGPRWEQDGSTWTAALRPRRPS